MVVELLEAVCSKKCCLYFHRIVELYKENFGIFLAWAHHDPIQKFDVGLLFASKGQENAGQALVVIDESMVKFL